MWVADDHAETSASTQTITLPGTPASPNLVICADHTQVAPATGDWKTTATVSNTNTAGGTVITIAGSAYVYGIAFKASGVTANQTSIQMTGAATNWQKYDTCSFQISSNSTNSHIFVGGTSGATNTSKCEWLNTTTSFGNASQGITVNQGYWTWKATDTAIAGTTPTTLFTAVQYGHILIQGVNLTAVTGTLWTGSSTTGQMRVVMDGCRIGSGVAVTGSIATSGGLDIWVNRCDNGANTYRSEHYSYEGTETNDTTMVLTGGTSDGTTPVSHKIVTPATNPKFYRPFESLPIVGWNSTTGSPLTVAIAGIWNAAALPNNDDIWMEVSFLGNASYPLLSFANNTKANNSASGSALTADSTSAWNSTNVASRANTTAYSLGDRIKLATNAGRVFFCTTAGTSAGSEPGGYASAVDGGSVTDNTAVFRAGRRFTLSVTCTSPALAGLVIATVRVAAASSTFWIDPKFNPQLS